MRFGESLATSGRRVFSALAVGSPCPRLRTSALTREGHSARLSRSPSLASAGCVRSLRERLPALSEGEPFLDGGVRAEILALSKSPTWGTHGFGPIGPLGVGSAE